MAKTISAKTLEEGDKDNRQSRATETKGENSVWKTKTSSNKIAAAEFRRRIQSKRVGLSIETRTTWMKLESSKSRICLHLYVKEDLLPNLRT